MQSMQIKIEKLESGFDWLKFLGKGIFTFLALFAAFVFFLFTRIESRMDKIDSRIDKLESGIQDIRILLIQSQQDTKQASPRGSQAKR